MAKGKTTIFYCQNCGYESTKWAGQCPACHEWNTFAEEVVSSVKKGKRESKRSEQEAQLYKLSDIELKKEERTSTGMEEFDRVLGGGLVKGSLVLLGGDPGIGKSTILLQACRLMAQNGKKIIYVSGEESPRQLKMRADRMGEFAEGMSVYCETNLLTIEQMAVREKPDILVIDSIQTMYHEEITSAPGSVSQVRESTGIFMQIAKQHGITTFLVGHVTKEGVVAGPRVLEHMVDTVLYFEGNRHNTFRVLRGVKNRFGATNEIGVFEMSHNGLREVVNPSEYMLCGKPTNVTGSVVACAMEGTRPVLLEIQALVCKTNFSMPRRTVAGTDHNRMNLLMAVVEKRLGYALYSCDAYINIAGGMNMNEPAVDLAVVLAIVSSYKNIIIEDDVICFGEVGLSGEVRAVTMMDVRVREAVKLGFRKAILPQVSKEAIGKVDGIELIGVKNIKEAVDAIK
ncbi:DNA repair protein RadA [Eubacterium oxidoreducens]|uniref:DNA repair protein RadA n=1 Tax=Eubacterium oxidoreducens TaxID=1732 RepID=A0A1G6AH55_EUBOX|nr:DNA repair protein RadA [Eubacterium oxidoreducens]SDB07735.1 DNA repair protein RadA/Sms [Eubacterium oxidoreducens]